MVEDPEIERPCIANEGQTSTRPLTVRSQTYIFISSWIDRKVELKGAPRGPATVADSPCPCSMPCVSLAASSPAVNDTGTDFFRETNLAAALGPITRRAAMENRNY